MQRGVGSGGKEATEQTKRVAALQLVSQAASTWLNHRLAFRGRGSHAAAAVLPCIPSRIAAAASDAN
ncbi:hypothetical protein E2562_016904 [Oryza meyeriana var. granulata]|uniref:Uncharacterized protein n=1 Tax=Oryza meyeriana var. granulata TaxID=110450 RepID=A0A6G1DXA5_9ORYZ|nr:hypothetical protein E2562_016904 [Oryza meyeriana var. granulata]